MSPRSAGSAAAARAASVVPARARGGRPSLFHRLSEDARDPGVRVLDVVDGVLLRLAPCELQVEVERRVMASLEHEEPRGVDADVVDQLVERHEFAPTLRHLRPRPALDEVDELDDRSLVQATAASQLVDRRPDLALRVQVALREPGIEVDPETVQSRFYPPAHLLRT